VPLRTAALGRRRDVRHRRPVTGASDTVSDKDATIKFAVERNVVEEQCVRRRTSP
jgi:hypothetical protein